MCIGGDAPDYEGAARIQAAAAERAAQMQMQMYQQARADVAPWREGGTTAMGQIGGLLNLPGYAPVDPTKTLQATPGYQWGLGQGVQALDRSAAARGMALSGPQRNAIQAFGQNYALQNAWQPYFGALQQLSGQGLGAGTFSGQAAMSTGREVGQDWMAAANATAQGMIQQQMANNQMSSGLFGGIGSLLGLAAAPLTGGTSLLGMGVGALGGLFGGGGGGGGGGNYLGYSMPASTYGALGGNIPLLFAEGGTALADRPYIVGEKGPELFVPKRDGYVVPNYALFPNRPAGPPMTERPPRGWNPGDVFPSGYAA